MAKVVMDSKGHQAIRHLGTESNHYPNPRAGDWKGIRLTGLEDALRSLGHSFEIVDIETHSLDDVGVLIIGDRNDRVPFDNEINIIINYSKNGGGILIMSNHPPGFVTPQNKVAEKLKLPISFIGQEWPCTSFRLLPHEISDGCQFICIRTGCVISVDNSPLVSVIAEHTSSDIGALAVAIEAGNDNSRIVAIGSAGHIASYDDKKTDMFSQASNKKWTQNIISWLLRTGNHDA